MSSGPICPTGHSLPKPRLDKSLEAQNILKFFQLVLVLI